jgi:flavin-dependent dehydrogenase
MHIRDEGYIGVAPLPDGIANVCVVRDRSTMARAPHKPLNAVVEHAILSDSLLRERFRDARRLTDVTSLGPLAVDAIGSGCPGLLLAGEAAGFVDPMTGDGLRFAFRGGELAADAALREISSGQPRSSACMRPASRNFNTSGASTVRSARW